jgi:hypothetical protein
MKHSNIISMMVRLGDDGPLVKVKGRDALALAELMKAGPDGLTTPERPAPRWSHYIFKCRRAGIDIETVYEGHAGPNSGNHARYFLGSPVEVIERETAHG